MSLYTPGKASQSLIDTIAFRAISQLATALGFLILVRGMASQDFGAYNLLYTFIPVVSTVASLGLEQVLRRYQPEYLSAGNTGAAAWLVRVVAVGRFGTNLLVLTIVVLGWNYFAPAFKLTPYKSVFMLFCLLILLNFQARVLQLALGSHMLQRYSVGSTAVLSVVKLAVYGLLFTFDALNLERAILVDTLAYAIAYAMLRLAYHRQCFPAGGVGAYRPGRDERKRMVRYGLLNNFNDAGVMLLYSTVDNFFIAHFTDIVSVGIYGFFSRLNGMPSNLLPTRLFDNIVQPLFFSTLPAEADRRLPQYFSFLLNMSLLLQWPLLGASLAYHAEFVQVLAGGKFLEYSWLLPVIVGFSTINVVADPVSLIAQYEEKADILLLSKVFVVYNIAAMAIMVPIFGIFGAALASGTAQVMKNAFVWWYVRRRAVWTNAASALSIGIPLWGAAVLGCLALKGVLSVPPIVQLLAGAVIFSLTMLVHVRTPAISSTDRRMLAAVTQGRATRLLQTIGVLPRIHAS